MAQMWEPCISAVKSQEYAFELIVTKRKDTKFAHLIDESSVFCFIYDTLELNVIQTNS